MNKMAGLARKLGSRTDEFHEDIYVLFILSCHPTFLYFDVMLKIIIHYRDVMSVRIGNEESSTEALRVLLTNRCGIYFCY